MDFVPVLMPLRGLKLEPFGEFEAVSDKANLCVCKFGEGFSESMSCWTQLAGVVGEIMPTASCSRAWPISSRVGDELISN